MVERLDTQKAAALAVKADDYVAQARAWKIETETAYNMAADSLKIIKAFRREAADVFDGPRKATRAAAQAVLDAFRKVDDPLKKAEQITKLAMGTYVAKIEKAAEDARRKAEAEAKKRAEAERVAAEQRALEEAASIEKAGLPDIAAARVETALAQPDPEPVAPVISAPPPPKVEGVHTRKKYRGRVVDLPAFAAWCLACGRLGEFFNVNQGAVDRHVSKVTKADGDDIPTGVEVDVETVVVSKG